jgi:hypothetical protein
VLRRLALTFVFALLACRGLSPGPVDAVTAYAQALREARYPDAYALLSSSTQRALPYDAFERAARERPDELRALTDDLDRADRRAPLTARVELPGGDRLSLLWEDGAWRIDPATFEFYPQTTPREALRSFARAVERSRWDVLLRLAPREVAAQLRMASSQPGPDAGAAPRTAEEALRDAWTGPRSEHDREVLRRMVEALDRGATLDTSGDRASLTYGAAGTYVARLVREEGLWKVERTD